MPDKVEALGILLLLLPGFICASLVQLIAIRPKQTEFDKVIEALLFSCVLYVLTAHFFGNTLPVQWVEHSVNGFPTFMFRLQWRYLATLTAGAGLLALLYSASLNHDWVHKLLRRLKLTERTSRLSVWNDTLQDIQSAYLLIELGDRRRVMGYPRYYSDDVEQSSIFLQDAAWLRDDGTQTPIDGPGILLTKEAGIVSITFLDPVITGSEVEA